MVCLAHVVHAIPTLNGPTGLINMPTAQGVQFKEYNVGIHYLGADSSSSQDWKYSLNLGTFKNWEIGIVGGKTPTEGVYVNAKYYLMSDQDRYPLSLAAGVENLFSKEKTNVYMVISKIFPNGLSAHGGFRALFTKSEVTPLIMAGASYSVTNALEVLGDLQGERNQFVFNTGIRFYVNPEFSVHAYLLDLGHSQATQSSSYALGTSFTRFF